MKGTALILLLAIAFTALSPFCVLISFVDRPDGPVLGSLDLCNSAAPATAAGGAMPCISTSLFVSMPVVEASSVSPQSPLITELILSANNEQPPRS